MSRRPINQTFRLPFDEADAPVAGGLPDARDRAAAVDPSQNVVLEASAGTGKTRVLVDRYTNLLKAGVDPANILAMTFTRKAAAEMRGRIVQNLRRAAEEGEIDPARWRELCDRMGEIAISTIDAFCLSLLREFPLEADLDPGFAMADETEVLRFLDEGLDATLRVCRSLASEDAAVGLVFAQLGESQLREGLGVLLERRLVARDVLRRFLVSGPVEIEPIGLCTDAVVRMRAILTSVDGGAEAFLADGPRLHPRFALLAQELRAFVLNDPKSSVSPGTLVHRVRGVFDRLGDHLLTQGGEPRTRWSYSTGDCDTADAWRRHRTRAASLAPRVAAELARFRRDLNVVLSRGVWRMFEIALAQYRRTLASHAVVDFPDALWRTLALLEQMDEFAQSRYLLEARYHHLLVDEFQDTSQAQWELVWRLVQSWAAGLGIGQDLPVQPSIFIVGDRKQSIYGFRDADVSVIAKAATAIAGLRPEGKVRRAIRTSFRAVPELLAFANDVFAAVEKVPDRPGAFEYREEDRFPVQVTASPGEPAVAVIAEATAEGCASAVAAEIVRLVESVDVRDKQTGVPRRARPGDVAILFRSREGHQAFEIALEAVRLPSYVYKGLGFFDTDEIKDAVALLRYLADPASDLRAAALVRSRIVRLSDSAVQALSPRLADALVMPVAAEADLSAEDHAVLGLTRSSLGVWLPLVDRIPPADLVDRILDESAYVRELAGAHAAQARQNLKKIRALVRRIQNRGYATIARVAEHLDRLSAGDESNAVIDAVDAVNLMTVHAAKGLEFPIVFLVNLGKGAGGTRAPIRLVTEDAKGEPSVAVGDFESQADAEFTDREQEETKRLLYVAVTRARDRLYLSAVVPNVPWKPARGSLGDVIPRSLADAIGLAASSQAAEMAWMGAEAPHRLRVCRAGAMSRTPRERGRTLGDSVGAGDFGLVADRNSVERIRATAVGNAVSESDVAGHVAPDTARLAGTLVHRLLEHLDAARQDDEERLSARLRSLMRSGDRADSTVADAAVGHAASIFRGLLQRPAFHRLFAAGERLHEVPFSLWRGGEHPVTPDAGGTTIVQGTIDSLVVTGDRVTVVEFKTGRPTSRHRQQLEVYLEAGRALYPERVVTGVIVYPGEEVWIDGGRGALEDGTSGAAATK